MTNEHRKHRRNHTSGKFRIQTSLSHAVHTVSLRDVSKNGAFIRTLHLPTREEKITFEILDDYGLCMAMGSSRVVRIVNEVIEGEIGFAIEFDHELDQAMLDYLFSLQAEETA